MEKTGNRSRGGTVWGIQFVLLYLFCWAVMIYLGACVAATPARINPGNVPVLREWSGDYPVAELHRLPAGQQDKAAGYIGDTETFASVWRAFMPGEIPPEVDFRKNIVVFTRNTRFYNRTAILKVELQDGTAEIIAMETMSARPIEDMVAMALAVIPRQGVMAIQTGMERVPVQRP